METIKRDLAGSAAKDIVIQKQTQTISTLEGEKHRLQLYLNDASHVIANWNREFYNFREQPEIAEVIKKTLNNRFQLDNPELRMYSSV